MLSELARVPHPTWSDLAISTQLVLWGLLIRGGLKKARREEQIIRRALILRHVKHHKGRFAHCRCSTPDLEKPLTEQTQMDQVTMLPAEAEYLFDP